MLDPVEACVAERGGDPSFRDAGLASDDEFDGLRNACITDVQGQPRRPEPISRRAVLDARATGRWAVDSLTARLTDAQMAGLDLADRMALVEQIERDPTVEFPSFG